MLRCASRHITPSAHESVTIDSLPPIHDPPFYVEQWKPEHHQTLELGETDMTILCHTSWFWASGLRSATAK